MLKIVLLIGAVILGTVMLIIVIGWFLPEKHVAARAISLHRGPEEVFQLISDLKAAPSWRSDVRTVEMFAETDGRMRYRETGTNGNLTMEVVELNSPSRMATRIADPGLPFGGMWVFDISPTPDGCRLNITERGEIYTPVFRFVSRYILGYNRTLDLYLQNVSRKFGESSIPREGIPAIPI